MALVDSPFRPGTVAAIAAISALVVGGALLVGEWSPWAPEPTEQPASRSGGDSEGAKRGALPDGVLTLESTWDAAWREARAWRSDAKLTRVYGTEVSPEGTLDRGSSVVQFVFVSPSATEAGPPVMNAYRYAVERGGWMAAEIMQHPAPELTQEEPLLCPVARLLGEDAPPRVTIDVQFAPPSGVAPTYQAFADKPEKWLLIADPATCRVQLRSSRSTAQEAPSAAAPSASAGGQFDARAAESAVAAALARAASCGTADAGLLATLTVTFAGEGSVARVEIAPEEIRSHPAAGCLANHLRRIQVAPWQAGAGRVVRRLPF